MPSTSFPTSSPTFSSQPSFQPSLSFSPTGTCVKEFPPGTNKILVDRDFNDGSTVGAGPFNSGTAVTTVTSYDQGYDGTTAISMTYSGGTLSVRLPAVRFPIDGDKLACLTPGTTIGISFKAKLLNVTDNREMSCDPLVNADCPEARLRIKNDNIGAQWNDNLPLGFSSWDPVSSSSSNWIAS